MRSKIGSGAAPTVPWLIGDSEMAVLIREKDWSQTPLGPMEQWSPELRTSVSICLASHSPTGIIWGPGRVLIYNEGYRPLCEARHPGALGQDFLECWASAWPAVAQAFENASVPNAHSVIGQRLFLARGSFLEETFLTFAFSPIRGPSGEVEGVFHTITETTQESLGERRLRILRELVDRAAEAQTPADACTRIAACLTEHSLDVPFALLYLLADNGKQAHLAGHAGLSPDSPFAPARIDLDTSRPGIWPLAEVAQQRQTTEVKLDGPRFAGFVGGPYPEPPRTALVLPVAGFEPGHPLAFLVAGVSSRRNLDEPYRTFYLMLRESVANALTGRSLRQREAQYTLLVDSLPDIVFQLDRNLRHLYISPTIEAVTGIPQAQWLGKTGRELGLPPRACDLFEEKCEEAFRTGQEMQLEFEERGRLYRCRVIPQKKADIAGDFLLGITEDITERRRAEEALRKREARLTAIFDRAAVGLSEISLEGRFLNANTELCRILGRTREEVRTLTVSDVTYSEDILPTFAAVQYALDSGGHAALDKRYQRPDGTLVWANSIVTVLSDSNGSPGSLLVVTVDLTDRRQAEAATKAAVEAVAEINEQLEQRVEERTRQLARMSQMRQELLRQLVGVQEAERERIARDLHDDLGQLIATLLLALSNLKNSVALVEHPEAQQVLTYIEGMASELTRKSYRLAFTLRPSVLDDFGLWGALSNYTEEWSRWSGVPVAMASVGLEEADGSYSRLPREVETTIYRIIQEALTNILRHAVGAGIPETRSADNRQSRGRQSDPAATRVTLLLQRRDGEVVAVIEDNGPGFDVEELSEPSGKRNLGIFGMQERARLAGGTLSIESSPGQGTTLFLRLPLPASAGGS